jgi:hypothetical protein
VNLHIVVLATCRLVRRYQRFRKINCVHLGGHWNMETTNYQTARCNDPQYRDLISFLVPGAVIRPKYGPCALDQIQDRRHCVADTHREERDAATLDFMRKLVSQMQVHVPAYQTVLNELCRNHSDIFLDRVQHFDMWALKSKYFIRCMYRPTR